MNQVQLSSIPNAMRPWTFGRDGTKLHHDFRCHPKLVRRKDQPNDSDAFDLFAEVVSKIGPKQSLPTVLWYIHAEQEVPNDRQVLKLFTEMRSLRLQILF